MYLVCCLLAIQEIRRYRFHPWVGKIPWSGAWQPTPVFLPGESHGQRSLAGYSAWGCKESDRTECACMHECVQTHSHTHSYLGKGGFVKGRARLIPLLCCAEVPGGGELRLTRNTSASPHPPPPRRHGSQHIGLQLRGFCHIPIELSALKLSPRAYLIKRQMAK